MVQVSVNAAVKVAGGPVLPMSLDKDVRSYTLTSSKLAKAGATQHEDKVPMPDGEITLIAVTAVDAKGDSAKVDVTLHGSTVITVCGSLLVANKDAVAQLIPTASDREVKLVNTGPEPVWVEILTCRGE